MPSEVDPASSADHELLAQRFEADRARLTAVAGRMLGSPSDADDAVQEAWLRLSRSEPAAIDNLSGWLTTVVARVCLDMLRSRRGRREETLDALGELPGSAVADPAAGPAEQAELADSVGLAMFVVLETLTPAERVAFVLHDMFGVPFDDIAAAVGRTPAAARQLASRGRTRVRGADPAVSVEDLQRQRSVVRAFLLASRSGDMSGLLTLLSPTVTLRADAAAVLAGAEAHVLGAPAVARTFAGRAQAARLGLLDGSPAAVWSLGGHVRAVFGFTLELDRIVEIELIMDPETLAQVDLVVLPGREGS